MYKDKNKQKEANRKAQVKFKANKKIILKGIADGLRVKGITEQGITEIMGEGITKPKRGKDIACFEDLHPEIQATINRVSERYQETTEQRQERIDRAIHYQHIFPDRYEPNSDLEFTTLMAQAGPGHARVSKPSDVDYDGICTPEWIAERTA